MGRVSGSAPSEVPQVRWRVVYARDDLRAVEDALDPIDLLQRQPKIPGFEALGKGITRPGQPLHGEGHEVRQRPLAIVADGDVMIAHVEPERPQDLAELERLAALARRPAAKVGGPGAADDVGGLLAQVHARELRIEHGVDDPAGLVQVDVDEPRGHLAGPLPRPDRVAPAAHPPDQDAQLAALLLEQISEAEHGESTGAVEPVAGETADDPRHQAGVGLQSRRRWAVRPRVSRGRLQSTS